MPLVSYMYVSERVYLRFVQTMETARTALEQCQSVRQVRQELVL
jgi:hypothetical protein